MEEEMHDKSQPSLMYYSIHRTSSNPLFAAQVPVASPSYSAASETWIFAPLILTIFPRKKVRTVKASY